LQLIENRKNNTFACGTEPISINKTGEWRFLTPERAVRISPCRQNCLLEGEIPSWLGAVKKGNWSEAWMIMRSYNPFPAITGYVCFSPCHDSCNRGQLDQGINIRAVEKAIGEWRLDHYEPSARPDSSQQKKIAIVGSGPAGLSCAYYLTEAGYGVTVYERSDQIGGMLALGIPEYRLPRNILARELAILKAEGVSFYTNKALGTDFQLEDLYGEYDQVYLATGAWLPRMSGIPGERSSSVYNALDFLDRFNKGIAPALGKTVVVVGGGNAALDSARSALRVDGVHHVILIYRRSRLEMPADQNEVALAESEGVEIIFNYLPQEILTEREKITAIKIAYCRTDRRGLLVDNSKSYLKECDSVIMALGQTPDYLPLGTLSETKKIYAGGDLISGPATVPDAIMAGRLSAMAIRSVYEELPVSGLKMKDEKAVTFEELNLAAINSLALKQREENPVLEAERCLGCGTCNSCGICYLFCPDLAVDLINGRFEFNLDYCKGCGICVNECPARALAMEGGKTDGI
jgi:2-oxoacid:acceptor oxidoreductase delta subunit (pyruvate/2-ketoisovalerate family)